MARWRVCVPTGCAPFVVVILAAALLSTTGCRSRSAGADDATGIIVINAPAAGEVRRVLVSEGVQVGAGAAIVEIAVRAEQTAVPQPSTEDPQARAARSVTAAQSEIEAARAEVVRTEVEVQRLTPLVASGEAPQGQLDGARAEYDRAQQRFRRAQDAAQGAQSGLIAARQPSLNPSPSGTPAEQIVAARASAAGTVSAINARVGEHVIAGQPLATLRAAAP
jgi:multidrug efflux pump subunit AcrA (membrane-fusion protein)